MDNRDESDEDIANFEDGAEIIATTNTEEEIVTELANSTVRATTDALRQDQATRTRDVRTKV